MNICINCGIEGNYCLCFKSNYSTGTTRAVEIPIYPSGSRIEPKERTIEEVEVGDVLEFSGFNDDGDKVDDICIEVVLGNVVGWRRKNGDDVYWKIKKHFKNEGWKIKQPEPEKEEKSKKDIADEIVNHFLDKGATVSSKDYDFVLSKLV